MKIKSRLIILIIIGAAVFSYFYSEEVYSFYLNFYYTRIKKVDRKDMLKKAETMFREKRYEELREYLRTLTVLYPDNRELRLMEGLTLIRLGEKNRGTDLILYHMGEEELPRAALEEITEALYERGFYREIIDLMGTRDPGASEQIRFAYGMSLFRDGQYGRAVKQLQEAIRQGRSDDQVHRYLGLAYGRVGDLESAEKYLEHARNLNYYDRDIIRDLVEVYRRRGKYDEAGRLARYLSRFRR